MIYDNIDESKITLGNKQAFNLTKGEEDHDSERFITPVYY
jgi:hypothetical protein